MEIMISLLCEYTNTWVMEDVNEGKKKTRGFGREERRKMCGREEGWVVIWEEKMWKRSLVVGKVSSRAMDCKRQVVRIPPLCPPIQVTKAHFGDSAGMAEKASVPHFPYFIYGPLESIVCECHGLAHLWEMHWRTYHLEDMLKFSIL